MSWQGVYTALVTPFDASGKVDDKALQALVEAQVHAGVAGLVPMGTTGESPTMSHEEHLNVVSKVVGWAKGRVPVVAGAGSNSTEEALMLTQRAKDLGASATLQVVPYYNKPNQEGLYRHFSTLADAVDLPLIVYNIPGRSGKNLETDTLMRLAAHPRIVGVKEASGDLGQIMDVLQRRPKGFSVLSGDDNLAYTLLALGGDGVISVASHLIPEALVELCHKGLSGDLAGARALHFRYLTLMKSMFLDTNPIPVKTALAFQGRLQEVFRLPMGPMEETKRQQLRKVMQDTGLL